jgi:hypothetical protein
MFEKVVVEDCTHTLVQKNLSHEHIINDNNKSIIIAIGACSQPLRLFCDAHSK